ncbi:ATP-binding protein [Candidatus Saganbacteria bacterium]|nr:ATP-binding protein [Candidatus Saganbacteria bacterium]
MFKRLQKFVDLGLETCFLWGARQTGKSTLLKTLFPNAPYYDLLLSDEFARLTASPAILRQDLLANHPKGPVILDEVQKIPPLLDEVQWLITNHKIQFILCGSSARKLRREGGNLLGGRALRYELFPLVYKEIPDFDLLRALNHGLIPRHYLAAKPQPLLESYVGEYLQEEIAAEAVTRNIPAFTKFLTAAAFSNGSIVNFKNIASECGVSAVTAKAYFQILTDTLVARWIPVFQKKPKRRVIQAPRFYFFDLGIVNYLLKRRNLEPGSEIFGAAFEHYILQEMVAYSHYSRKKFEIAYWRTASQLEVDFILGDHEIAVEIKAAKNVNLFHLKGLKAFSEEYSTRQNIVVSLDPRPRQIDNINILPWQEFLEKLWAGQII